MPSTTPVHGPNHGPAHDAAGHAGHCGWNPWALLDRCFRRSDSTPITSGVDPDLEPDDLAG